MNIRFGAVALAAALVFAPLTPPIAFAHSTVSARQDDAPTEAEQNIFNKGRDHFAKGQYEQAATIFRDFLKKSPDSFIADLMLLWLGRSYIELGQLREAEQVARQLRSIKDTPFADIYDGELQAARSEAARRGPAPADNSRADKSPSGAVARATPTPARPRPTPAPVETARENSDAPSMAVRGGGNSSRPRNARQTRTRTTQEARDNPSAEAAATTPTPAPTATPTPTPPVVRPTPVPRETPAPTPARSVEVAAQPSVATEAPQGQAGFSITVKQVPDLQLALRRAALAAQPGQAIQLPLVVTNSGNKEDQFRLETDLPAEYQPTFSQRGNDTGLPIFVTPQMARGSNMEVMLNIRVPDNAPDNQQQRFLIRAASQADSTILKVADASLTIVAAALNAQSNVLQQAVQPGDTFTQRIAVRNQGSATARQTRADFVFNPDFELVSATPAPISYDRPSRTAIWSLGDLESRDAREITVTLRAVQDALAANDRALGRGTLHTQSLVIPSNFDGPAITVGRVPAARVDPVSPGLTATPGDVLYIPFIVRNPSNYPESFEMRVVAPGAPQATVYADANGDGQHQENEPAVGQTPALDPRGGQFPVLLRVDIPRSTPDRQQFAYNLVTRALSSQSRIASEANTVLTVAAPRVRVRAELPNSEVRPGESFFYRLVLVNDGGGLAKNLNVTEYLPDALEFISSSPQLSMQEAAGGTRSFVWRLNELAPGDTSVLLVTVRLRPNLRADDVISTRHTLTYQDTNGNSHTGR